MIADERLAKRETLKDQIKIGKYKSLADVILDEVIGRRLQKLTRSAKPISFWYSGVVMALATLLVGTLMSIASGEFYSIRGKVIWRAIWATGLGFLMVIGTKTGIRLLLTTLYESTIDSIESVTDLDDLQSKLASISDLKKQLFFSLAMGLVAFLWPVVWDRIGVDFPGWGLTLVLVIVWFQSGVANYHIFPLLTLPVRLSRYHFKLYAADPSSSEVIDCLSDMLNSIVFIVAAIEGAFTLGMVFLKLLDSHLYIFWVLGAWGILIVMFVNNQYALARIISKAKQKKLNEIQAKIEKLEAENNIADKETMEAINRLMDYHDRIKAARNSALDLRAGLDLLNALLLPVIGLLLGNIKAMTELFFK